MSDVDDRVSPLDQLRRSLPSLPHRLREAGRFIADHEFDATTRSMRDLATAAGLQPATFTRLAQAIGHAGWEEFRSELIEASRPEAPGPFSDRRGRRAPDGDGERLVSSMLSEDAQALGRLREGPIVAAAATLHAAQRIWVAGYRSSRSVAVLLHYQLSLFRSDVRLVGAGAPEDLEFGAFRGGDAVVAVGFAPFSRAIAATAQEARRAGCTLVALADGSQAPIAEGADHLLLFEAAATPSFFHSLTGAVATAQALAAVVFEMAGAAGVERLRLSEARLASLSEYVPERT